MSKAASSQARASRAGQFPKPLLGLLVVFVLAATVLSFAFHAAEWRAQNSLIPRYCDAPERHLAAVRRLLTQSKPVDAAGRRVYMIAAKLLFVVPRTQDETVDTYISRLRGRIAETCR